jgi:hypothetical protein
LPRTAILKIGHTNLTSRILFTNKKSERRLDVQARASVTRTAGQTKKSLFSRLIKQKNLARIDLTQDFRDKLTRIVNKLLITDFDLTKKAKNSAVQPNAQIHGRENYLFLRT